MLITQLSPRRGLFAYEQREGVFPAMMWPWEQARRNSSTGKSDEKDPLERSRNRPYIGVERWLHIVLGGC